MQLSTGMTESMREHGLTVENHPGFVTVSGFRNVECFLDSRTSMQRQGYFVRTLDLIDCATGKNTPILAIKRH